MRINFTRPRLSEPPPPDRPDQVRYLLGVCMQVSTTRAALCCNRHVYGKPVDDLEDGSDAVIFDRLDAIDPRGAVPLVRNHHEPHPRTGRPLLIIKFPVFGGFVPLGAKLPDGRPHPHAGTGFGHSTTLGSPADLSSAWPAGEPDALRGQEIQQYRYDGLRFDVLSSHHLPLHQPLDGWELHNGPLTSSLPDGEDLLFGMTVSRPGRSPGVGLTRWRKRGDGWWPIACVPVSGEDCSGESSLVRLADGSLLMAARGATMGAVHRGLIKKEQIRPGHFLLWRSTDGGNHWTKTMDVPGATIPGPVSINRTRTGRPFFAANRPSGPVVDGNGKSITPGGVRTALSLWPINDNFDAVGERVDVLDCAARFGPTPSGSLWLADHPTGCIVRFADERLHSLLSVRVAQLDETSKGIPPTPQSGCWIDQVIDDGPDVPVWTF